MTGGRPRPTAAGPTTFREAVEAARPPANRAWRPGLEALERWHPDAVTCKDEGRLTGSINLDAALAPTREHGGANRWDYGVGHRPPKNSDEQAVWVEFHDATVDEIDRVLRKKEWLTGWLTNDAKALGKLTARTPRDRRFVWIAVGRSKIVPGTPEARRLEQNNVRLEKRLSLP